ncbi:MAG TPA: FtsX-like permease family protein [Motilibacteraceae bacterium]|nr:FtsX-like permease family protein [Motilibacteraceae bacterium]
MSTLRLGLRLAVAGGRAGRVRALLVVGGTALGVLVLLVVCAIPAVQAHQDARMRSLWPMPDAGAASGPALLWGQQPDVDWRDRSIVVVQVATADGHAPLLPRGVDALPGPGKVVVSPALRDLLRQQPDLAQLVPGQVVGTISRPGLVRPDDLRAYVGVPPDSPGLAPVTAFADPHGSPGDVSSASAPADGSSPAEGPSRPVLTDAQRLELAVLVFLGVPVLVLIASAARLSAATRDRRLAALRLLGLTPGRTRAVAAAEAGAHAVVGAVLGAGLFWLLRPLTEPVRVAGLAWFADDLTPPAALIVAVLVGVPLACIVIALTPTFGMRRPLLVRRSGPARAPRRWRLLPLVTGVALLGWAISRPVRAGVGSDAIVPYFLAGTALAGFGLPLALPVAVRLSADRLTRRGPAVRMAARRIQLEPTATTRVVAALVTALFVSAGAQAVLVAFERTPQYLSAQRAETTGPQYLDLNAPPGTKVDVEALAHLPGVRQVRPLTEAQAGCEEGHVECVQAFVGTCRQLQLLMPTATTCDDRTAAWLGEPQPDVPSSAPLVFHPTGLEPGDPSPAFTIPPPTVSWPLATTSGVDADAHHFWSLFVPIATAGAADVVAAGSQDYSLVADGGAGPRDALAAFARRMGPQVASSSEEDMQTLRQVMQYRSILWAVTAAALFIGFAAVAITALDRAVERRRQLAAFHVLGAPRRLLRRSQLVQTLLPLAIGLPAAAAAGLLAGRAYLQLIGEGAHTPWRGVLATLGLGLLAALLVAAVSLPGIGRRVTPELLRRE